MDFYEVVAQVLALLQRHQRVSYRALTRQFGLDEAYLDDLKEEFLYAHAATVEADDRGFVWMGETASAPPPVPDTPVLTAAPDPDHTRAPLAYTPPHLADKILAARPALEGERK